MNMKEQRKLLYKGLEERQTMIHEKYEKVLEKYPGASEKLKSKKGADALNKIIAQRKKADADAGVVNEDDEGDEDDDNVDFDTYNQ